MFRLLSRPSLHILPVGGSVWLHLLLAAFFVLAAPARALAGEFLEPEKAFRFSARLAGPDIAEITFQIADGYYMYRERFAFHAEGAQLGEAEIPAGKIKYDETFQKDVETHRGTVDIRLPVQAVGPFILRVTSQGCSDKGLCYSPMESVVRLAPGGGGNLTAILSGPQASVRPYEMGAASAASAGLPGMDSAMGRIEASLASGSLVLILPLFLLLGLGLSLTPCVLPMVPILSSLIVGEGRHVSRARGFGLALAYSFGMALVYTALGVAAGLAGEGLAANLQQPAVLVTFAVLMVFLSLAMFGTYQLQVPPALQARLMRVSDRQAAGRVAGVFTMGAVSALIIGPCVAAPLAGVLLYISQTGNAFIGGSALFAMAAGMSVPLLLLGLSAGALLPRAGPWMEAIKYFFGVLMLLLAVWIVAPVVPAWATMVGWGLIAVAYGVFLLRGRWGRLSKAGAVLFLGFGLVQLGGMASGGRDALAPLAHLGKGQHKVDFQKVRSVEELDAVLATANGRTVMLDFYADWCVSCIEMEKLTFSDPRVKAHMDTMLLLQADVTANNADDKALLRRFKLFGPPGIIFFDGQGREIPGGRVIGFQNAARFAESLELARSF